MEKIPFWLFWNIPKNALKGLLRGPETIRRKYWVVFEIFLKRSFFLTLKRPTRHPSTTTTIHHHPPPPSVKTSALRRLPALRAPFKCCRGTPWRFFFKGLGTDRFWKPSKDEPDFGNNFIIDREVENPSHPIRQYKRLAALARTSCSLWNAAAVTRGEFLFKGLGTCPSFAELKFSLRNQTFYFNLLHHFNK